MAEAHRQQKKQQRKDRAKYRRARVRKILFTVGPHRLTGGRLTRRHLSQDVVVREIEISTPRWPTSFDGLRIGHVSDFHLGDLLPLDQALGVVRQLDELAPDLVACTGDVVDLNHDEAQPLLEAIAHINAPMGAALVLGNHDELHCREALSQMALDAGLMLLRNEAVRFHHDDGELVMAGIEWARTSAKCATYVDRTCGEETHLLLAHNPRAFPRAADHNVALTLAGHTHGGQVAMKNRPAANLAATRRHTAGLYEAGDSRLYVTAGVGAWFPLRLNCPAEIAIITVRSGNGAAPSDER